MAMDPEKAVRLQVYLSRAGVCSRRRAEELIREGKVRVDGTLVTQQGLKIVPGKSIVEVEGKAIQEGNSRAYILLHKPKGVLSTARDERKRKTVLDLILPAVARVYPVGRLDKESEGLILLTNDGELAHRLTHPGFDVAKTYRVGIRGRLGKREKKTFRQGMELEEGRTREAEIRFLSSTGALCEYEVVLREGRKRQIRRMMERLGFSVMSLRRTKEGSLCLGSLKPGEWRHLKKEEIEELRKEVGLS